MANLTKGLNAATLTLCLCAVTHTYLLFNVLPYSGYMSISLLHSRVTVDSVGFYAASLGTALSAGRCLGFVPWKAVRGRVGGKTSLLYSLLLSAALSIWFGLSRTYASAIIARFLLGFANNISGCVKREAMDQGRAALSGESAEQRDGHAQARVLAVMWWGSALGPLLGGILSNPGNFAPFLHAHYRVLLPNVVAAALCLLSMTAVLMFIKDGGKSNNGSEEPVENAGECRPLLRASIIESVRLAEFSLLQDFSDIWKSKNARDHMVAYWGFSFVVTCIDEALPLFFISRLSGPGLSERAIGLLFGLAGLVVALSQHLTLERLFEDADLYARLRLSSLLGTVPCVLIPLALVMNGGTYDALGLTSDYGNLTLLSGIYLTALTAFIRIFVALYFAFSGVAIARTVPHTYRDAAARVLTLGALCSRAVAPIVAGALVSIFLSLRSYGAFALWLVMGLLFGLGAVAATFYLKEAGGGGKTRSEKRRSLYLDRRQRAEVFVKLWEVHYEKDSNTASAKWRRLARKAIAANRLGSARGYSVAAATEETGVTDQQARALPAQERRKSWVDHILHRGMDAEKVPFFILGTTKNDSCSPHILTPPLMQTLHKQLPMAVADCNFWLRYSLVRDGASIAAIDTKAGMSKNTFLAIETLDGNVFGCFMTTPWRMTNTYVLSPESFLWRMKNCRRMPEEVDGNTLDFTALQESEIDVFPFTGENSLCQLLSHDRIAAGGGTVNGKDDGFGFIVGGGLMSGTSGPCITYNNPCLCPDSKKKNGQFDVANIEVWAMTPFLFAADAERSECHMHFVEGNLSNAGFKETPIVTQSAWSNFL